MVTKALNLLAHVVGCAKARLLNNGRLQPVNSPGSRRAGVLAPAAVDCVRIGYRHTESNAWVSASFPGLMPTHCQGHLGQSLERLRKQQHATISRKR